MKLSPLNIVCLSRLLHAWNSAQPGITREDCHFFGQMAHFNERVETILIISEDEKRMYSYVKNEQFALMTCDKKSLSG